MDVDGHWDRKVTFQFLTPLEKLNCRANAAAKVRLDVVIKASQHPMISDCIYGEGIHCCIGNTKVSGNPHQSIQAKNVPP